MKKEELRKCEKPLNVRKANSIIQSIGRVTLLANKVFMTALIRVQAAKELKRNIMKT